MQAIGERFGADASDREFRLQWVYSSHRGVGLMAVRQRRYSKRTSGPAGASALRSRDSTAG
jgi:hypothetical protein